MIENCSVDLQYISFGVSGPAWIVTNNLNFR